MLTSLSRMIGMPVIWQDQNLGYVERALPDISAGRLDGLSVRKGIGWARWICGGDVKLLGSRCVVLAKKPERMPRKAERELRRAFLTTGECAGEVTDVIIDGCSLAVAALEICQGPFCRLAGERRYAPEFLLNPNGEAGEVVIPQLLSWTQLTKHFEEEDEE